MAKTEKIYVRVTETMKDRLYEMADFKGTTISALVCQYVSDGLSTDAQKQRVFQPENVVKMLEGLGFTKDELISLSKKGL